MDAFFGGQLFPAPLLEEMQAAWHRVFFPLEYGTGIMRFGMPAVLTGLRRLPPLAGHSGASGVVMFRCHVGPARRAPGSGHATTFFADLAAMGVEVWAQS